MLHLGIHAEALLFTALVLHLGLEAASVPRGSRVPKGLLIALGLSAGLGTWFSYQVPLAVLCVIVLLALRRARTIFRPELMVATVVGLAPWLVMFAAHGSGVFDLHGEEIGGGHRIAKFFGSLREASSRSLVAPALLFGFIGVVAGAAFELPRGRRMRALILVGGFVDLWAVATIVSGLEPNVRPDTWFGLLRFAPAALSLIHI